VRTYNGTNLQDTTKQKAQDMKKNREHATDTMLEKQYTMVKTEG